MEQWYKCKQCDWVGVESDLEYDSVETCFGQDKIEMCPNCGSYEVVRSVATEKKNETPD